MKDRSSRINQSSIYSDGRAIETVSDTSSINVVNGRFTMFVEGEALLRRESQVARSRSGAFMTRSSLKQVPSPAASHMTSSHARPIDLVHLSRQSLGDRNLEQELLQLFDRQSALILLRLDERHAMGERRWLRDLCHTLDGSARAVGAVHVSAAAGDYGQALLGAASDGELEILRAGLVTKVQEARAHIANLLRED
jgi:HPt (histidine-containing phosphotransfer) domain-containing protein